MSPTAKPCTAKLMSSANVTGRTAVPSALAPRASRSISSSRSSTHSDHSSGPRIVPCGTPLSSSTAFARASSTLTIIFRSLRNSATHRASAVSPRPWRMRRTAVAPFARQNALSQSTETKSVTC